MIGRSFAAVSVGVFTSVPENRIRFIGKRRETNEELSESTERRESDGECAVRCDERESVILELRSVNEANDGNVIENTHTSRSERR